MSAFGAKRKARVIKVDDLEDELNNANQAPSQEPVTTTITPTLFSKGSRKPFRQSGLRKSINAEYDDRLDDAPTATDDASRGDNLGKDDDEKDDDGPVVIRPSLSRAGSTKQKKRASSSRLSFGRVANDDDDPQDGNSAVFTPKKSTLGQKVLENNAVRKGVPLKGLPVRSLADDDDRPRYSKEYLEELQSSTPNTPQNISSSRILDDDDEMNLDISELDGAMIVEADGVSSAVPATRIMTEAEVREKKERRARLAHEKDFISLDGGDEDDPPSSQKKKDDSRLVREDEDLGEGFDDFVEDGGLAVGRKAEKASRKRHRQEMAELIQQAEGDSEEESDASDAERRAAFEIAQTRAGMDGLQRPQQNPIEQQVQPKPKITSLMSLGECMQRLRDTMKKAELELAAKSTQVAQLKQEKEEIAKREAEVQRLLNEAGEKYQVATGGGPIGALESATHSPARPGQTDFAGDFAGERGLESFGTPSRKDAEQTPTDV